MRTEGLALLRDALGNAPAPTAPGSNPPVLISHFSCEGDSGCRST